MYALSNYDDENSIHSSAEDDFIQLRGKGGLMDKQRRQESSIGEPDRIAPSPYIAMLELETVDPCAGSVNSFFSYNWKGAFVDAKNEFLVHIDECRKDMFENEENTSLDKFLLMLELPFIILRKVMMIIDFLLFQVSLTLFCISIIVNYCCSFSGILLSTNCCLSIGLFSDLVSILYVLRV